MSRNRFREAYRVIYNQDCTNLFSRTRAPIRSEHVDGMVDEVADGGANVMLINPNGQKVNYPSKVWETFWEGDPSQLSPRNQQMKRLADSGCDYLERALGRCRQRGITPGVSVRMNDMHGAREPDTWPDNSHFYKQHPEHRLPGPISLGWGRVGLNYEHAAVREHYFTLIKELVGRYDFDVLELDFMRFHAYFPRGRFDEHCVIMTEFVRQARTMTTAANRKIILFARVASTPAAAYELGFDIAAWGRERLVDGITFTEFLNTGWEMPVDEFRALVGDEVALYAGADVSADRRPGLPVRYMPVNERLLRGFASAYLTMGADGLYFFNYFTVREKDSAQNPLFHVLGQIASLEQLRGAPKTCLVTSTVNHMPETDLPGQAPVALGGKSSREFSMQLAKEPEGAEINLQVVFAGEAAADQLWLRCNNVPVGTARSIDAGFANESSNILKTSSKISLPAITLPVRTAEFALPARAVRNGRNRLTLRNEGQEITIHGLELHVL